MINIMYHREGNDERCQSSIKGSIYELAMEYTILSKTLAEKYPEVIELSQILLPEVSTEEDD